MLATLRESEILRELAELLTSSLDLNHILQVLVKRTTEVCQIERCTVWLLDDIRNILRPATYHLSSQQMNNHTIMAADHIWYHGSVLFNDPDIFLLLQEKGLLVVDDFRDHPKIQNVAETFFVHSALLIALKREDRMLGMMSLDDPSHKRTFSPEQQQLALAIGQQAALAIDNARLYQQAQSERKRAERLIERAQAINQVALTVNSGEDLAAVLKIATHHLVRGLNADGGKIVLLDAGTFCLAETTKQGTHLDTSVETTFTLQDLPNVHQAAISGSPLYLTAQQASESEVQLGRDGPRDRSLGRRDDHLCDLAGGPDVAVIANPRRAVPAQQARRPQRFPGVAT